MSSLFRSVLHTAALGLTLSTFAFGCGVDTEDDDGDSTEDAVRRDQDSLDRPTDTKIDLEPGLWHDNKLVPGEGWHVYHFTARTEGYVAFQMQAPPGHPNLWSYIRLVDKENNNQIWAGVGNKKTNLCDIIVYAEAGKKYDVIVTSQENSLLVGNQRQYTDGPYTIAVSPVDVEFP